MFRIKSHQCKECGERLEGRGDKVFCDDRCRMRFHRHSNASLRIRKGVDHVLQRNRNLLIAMRGKMHTRWNSLDCAFWLRRKGFDFNFHTHIVTLTDGRMAIMCYEEGYVLDGNGILPWSETSQAVMTLLSSRT